jgi:uncharacterized protein YbcI
LTDVDERASRLAQAANTMVQLHKEQFGRGPTRARAHFAGTDGLVCVLEDALLPAERKMTAMGNDQSVRDSRARFQVATAAEFIEAVESIFGRRVRSFASAIDPVANVVFENFVFEETDGR